MAYEATRNIRDPKSVVNNKKIPVIAMTANVMQGDREKCEAVDMDEHIGKPINQIKLQQALEKWLPSSCKL